MTTSFPTSLDVLTNPTSSDTLASVTHSTQHANENDAIEALQAKVGVDSSAVTTSHDYLLRHLATAAGLTSTRLTTAGAAGQLVDYAGLCIFGTPSSSAPSTGTNGAGNLNGLVLQNTDSVTTRLAMVQHMGGVATSSGIFSYVCQGTAAVPGATLSGDQVLFSMRGHDGTNYTGTRAAILLSATEAWSPTTGGSQIALQTTAVGATSSVARLTLTSTAATFAVPILPGSGTVGAPSYAFSTDSTTGWYRTSASSVSLAAAGVEILRLSTSAFTWSRNTSVALGTAPIQGLSSFTVHGADAATAGFAACAYGSVPTWIARRCEGTAAAPTQTTSGVVLWRSQVMGYQVTGPAFTSALTTYEVGSSEAFTSTAQGFRHIWYTNANGTISPAAAMRLENSGNLLIGTTTDGLTAAGSLAITQDLAHRGTKIGFMNTAPIAQKTGYGTPTGNSYQASFAAGSITLPNLAAQVAQLIVDLKAYGIIGA